MSYIQVDGKLPCQLYLHSYITLYSKFLNCGKNTFSPLLYIRFHKKLMELSTITFTFLKFRISISQSSNTQVDGKIPWQSQKYIKIYKIFQLFNMLKKHLQTLLYIRFHKRLTELLAITFTFLKFWIIIQQSSNT